MLILLYIIICLQAIWTWTVQLESFTDTSKAPCADGVTAHFMGSAQLKLVVQMSRTILTNRSAACLQNKGLSSEILRSQPEHFENGAKQT